MKTVRKFSRTFPICVTISIVLIVVGIISVFVRGINFGIDFVPGLVEEVRIAPPAIKITYSGAATASVEASNTGVSIVISGLGAENETRTFTFGQNPTVSALAQALSSVDGVTAFVTNASEADSYGIYVDSASTARLSSDSPLRLYVSDGSQASIDDVRSCLEGQNVVVKELGAGNSHSFQIRAAIGEDDESNEDLQFGILSALQGRFGRDNIAIIKTDFVGSQFSSSLALKSVILAVVTLFIIWLYATIRFHWDFALGATIALLHDCLIMFAFIAWTQVEFSTTTFAAILTIFGYSINASVVILDRVRENIRLVQTKDFKDILDASISGTVSRSIITTVTTLFASVSLLVFTSGSIRDFAIVLTVGLLAGCYSSMFICPAFISVTRRNWEPGEFATHTRPHVKKNRG